MTVSGVQGVVMAGGKGSRMTELTASRPKCILPVGNFPMIWYPLQLLERSGIQDALIVVQEQAKADIQNALEKCPLKLKYDLVPIPAGEDWGTADSLRFLEENNKIKCDVVVVSCDLITDVSLGPMIDLYRRHSASIVALFAPSVTSSELPTPGPKTKNKMERDLIGIHYPTSKLTFIASAADYEESLPFSKKLLQRYGSITLHSKLLDGHVYIIKKWLCTYLATNKSLSTIKGELLPYIVKRHLNSAPKPKMDNDKASMVGLEVKSDLIHFAHESDLSLKVRKMSTYTDTWGEPIYNNESIRCYAHVVDKGSFTIRANSIQQYCLANRQVVDKWNSITNHLDHMHVSPLATINTTQIEKETCFVGEKCLISEKTSVKSSIIGPNVMVHPKTRISNSIVMNGVTIQEGCVISNCVICEESTIEKNTQLKNCIVGSHFTVLSGCHENEVLTDSDRLMEI